MKMQDEYTEKLTIRNERMTGCGDLDAYDKVRAVFIAKDFDMDPHVIDLCNSLELYAVPEPEPEPPIVTADEDVFYIIGGEVPF